MDSRKTTRLQSIRNQFPQLHWKSAKYIASGYDHDVIILDNTTVVRFPKNSYSKKLLRDEIGLLDLLRNHIRVAIPQYQFVAADYSCAGYSLIQGSELTVKKLQRLSARQITQLTKDIATFLSELHAISLAKIKSFRS